jgi:hypothetical protein
MAKPRLKYPHKLVKMSCQCGKELTKEATVPMQARFGADKNVGWYHIFSCTCGERWWEFERRT